jgi:hypothetical protein
MDGVKEAIRKNLWKTRIVTLTFSINRVLCAHGVQQATPQKTRHLLNVLERGVINPRKAIKVVLLGEEV